MVDMTTDIETETETGALASQIVTALLDAGWPAVGIDVVESASWFAGPNPSHYITLCWVRDEPVANVDGEMIMLAASDELASVRIGDHPGRGTTDFSVRIDKTNCEPQEIASRLIQLAFENRMEIEK